MKKEAEYQKVPMRTCSLCNKSSETKGASLIYFGEWMIKNDITVHYYCLLLSTNLPQRGEDHSGILGFLLRDIRFEITMAKKRQCMYCSDVGATIQCAACKKYFHLTCGHTSKCLFQFVGEFKSYCRACLPVDKFLRDIFTLKPPSSTELCYICAQKMGTSPERWIYAKCCGKGFTHAKCMKSYALSAGYYLTCIWCKDKRFREDVKYLGIFVPDRDANWEKEKGAYEDLYRVHKRCDMEKCNCPKGRDYISALKWQLIICKLCGAFGAHNPACIPGFESSKERVKNFKCDVCSITEQTVFLKANSEGGQDLINTSLYVSKDSSGENDAIKTQIVNANSSYEGMIAQATISSCKDNSTPTNLPSPKTAKKLSVEYILTQSPQSTQQIEAKTGSTRIAQQELSDIDSSEIADLFVQKMIDIFEVNLK